MTMIDRRALLYSGAGALLAAASPVAAAGAVTGRGPGDFDFLTGEWTIRLLPFDPAGPRGGAEERASATVRRVLNGAGSIEELRNGDGSMWGMGVRVWLPKERVWADHWTAAADGVVNPPQRGRFIDGAGIFTADDEDAGKPVRTRATWDRITPRSCRWFQEMSRDGGASWERGWYMDWTRVA